MKSFFAQKVEASTLIRAKSALDAKDPWIRMEGICIFAIHATDNFDDRMMEIAAELLDPESSSEQIEDNVLLALGALPGSRLAKCPAIVRGILVASESRNLCLNAAILVGRLAAAGVETCRSRYAGLLESEASDDATKRNARAGFESRIG
jgi:hypothetical protein